MFKQLGKNIQVKNVKAELIDAKKGNTLQKWTLENQKLFQSIQTIGSTEELIVKVDAIDEETTKKFVPSQNVIILRHDKRNLSIAKFMGSASSSTISFTISSEGMQSQLGTLTGPYSMFMIIADSKMKSPSKMELGKLLFTYTPKRSGDAPPEPPLYLRESPQEIKPDFDHILSPPAKRPPAIISLIFTVAALCPIALLVLVLPSAGVNFKRMSGILSMEALLFHGSIGLILVVLALYWIALPLFKTLPLLGFASVAATFLGYRVLSQLALKEKKA